MKEIKILYVLVMLLPSSCAFSQRGKATDTIEVALNKTTYIHITGPQKPYTMHVGGVAGNVYYDSIAASNGMMWVRAGKENITESNMIIAAQDTVLMFVLKYSTNPKTTLWMYDIHPVGSKPPVFKEVIEKEKTEGEKNIVRHYEQVSKLKPYLGLTTTAEGVGLELQNIYTDSVNLYYKFSVKNKSKIDYEIDGINFMLKTRPKNNRKAVTGEEQPIVYTADNTNENVVPVKTERVLLFKTAMTPIRSDEIIVFTIYEKTTMTKGRVLSIKINPYIFYKMNKR